MAPLSNPRHERFCLGLAEGLSASASYVAAGYQESRHSASRLATKDTIKARLAELQEIASRKTQVTIESIIEELTDLATKATNRSQYGSAIKAVVEKARVAGLLVERVEVKEAAPFDDNSSPEVILAAVARERGAQAAHYLALAFGIEWNGEEMRDVSPTAQTFKPATRSLPPPVSQYASEERKPRRNGR